ncbi:MAG: site-specific integrase [Oscillospiraceae bacterium]|nr:site-specific integrase [Oscillospiraceae bacterium]
MKTPAPKQLPSGTYRVQVMVDGNRYSVTDDDPKVAVAKAMAIKAKLEEAKQSPRSMTVGAAVDRYIESKDSVLLPSTVCGYKNLRNHSLAEIENVKLPDLTQEKVQRWVNKLSREKSPKTVRNAHGLLSAALGEFKPEMTLRTTLPQKVKYEVRIPSSEEIKQIFAAVKGTEMELPVLLAVWLGLRSSEIRGLTWDCIRDGKLHVRQALVPGENGQVLKGTKSYSGTRVLSIPPYIQTLIDAAPKEREFLVPFSDQALYKRFTNICKRLGIQHYRFHDLRHANASVMLALGVPDKYAMERMGHATNNMLKNVYQHTMKDKQEEVSNAVDDYFKNFLE